MTVIIASTLTINKITNSQERLEATFRTVDTIKSDLNKCGMRLQEARQLCAVNPFFSAAGSFTCTYGLADEQLLEEVSDFYVTYFPDANSVLYRIEVNSREQIRG